LENRGFIVALDDDDLRALVAARRDPANTDPFRLIRERFDELVA
jgi:hypothetical protein